MFFRAHTFCSDVNSLLGGSSFTIRNKLGIGEQAHMMFQKLYEEMLNAKSSYVGIVFYDTKQQILMYLDFIQTCVLLIGMVLALFQVFRNR